jgi:methylthioribose-1-phosphate isomerase
MSQAQALPRHEGYGLAPYEALRRPPGARHIEVIDQRALPATLRVVALRDLGQAVTAIRDMWVRGAPLIGAVGAYGLAMALDVDASGAALAAAHATLDATRPTAVNLRWALDRVRRAVEPLAVAQRANAAWREADRIRDEDMAINAAIGNVGLTLLRELAGRVHDRPVNVMTHCNAGALATCGHGTATSPLFLAHAEGLPLHVYVSETRPRLQGANLTAWEMARHGIAHTLFVDGASALLLQREAIDLVIVGADRVARNGDVCNKIGTYDKALAAHDNGVPFYVALPSPTIDWRLASGSDIPIESRGEEEVLRVRGIDAEGEPGSVHLAPRETRAVNFAFDVTRASLVSGYITERGIAASASALAALFPELSAAAAAAPRQSRAMK